MFHWAEHRVVRGCAVALGAAVLLLGLLALAGYLYDLHWQHKVEAKLAEFRAAGEPVTWEDWLARRPKIPDAENSALILLKGFEHLTHKAGGCDWQQLEGLGDCGRLGERHSAAWRSLVDEYLKVNAEALGAVHEAAKLEQGCYPIEREQNPWDTELPHLPRLRRTVELCVIEAQFCSEEGDIRAAVLSLGDAHILLASVGDCPFLMEALVRMTAEAIWLEGIESTAAECTLAVDELQTLRAHLSREAEGLSLAPAFYSERSMGHWIFSRTMGHWILGLRSARELGDAMGDSRGSAATAIMLYSLVPGLREKDALYFYDALGRGVSAAKMSPRQQLAESAKLSREVDETLDKSPYTHIIGGMLMPAFGRVLTEEAASGARLSVARTALGVEEWRLKHGSWPDSLEQLVPDFLDAVPDDPFSESPIRYAKTATGVVVYSVGKDSKDDGGISEEEARKRAVDDAFPEPTWDLPFRVLNPELRGATTLSFRDEIAATRLDLDALEKAGLTKERLLERGLTEDDLKRLAEQ
jgi:hypothetical protein